MSISPLTKWQIREMTLNMEINETNAVIKVLENHLKQASVTTNIAKIEAEIKYYEARRSKFLDEIFEMTVLGGAEALEDK